MKGRLLYMASCMAPFCFLAWRTRPGRSRSASRRRTILLTVLTVGVLITGFGTVSIFGSSKPTLEPNWFANESKHAIPNYALKIADGESAGTSWGVWLFGRGGTNCWGTKARN